MDRAKAEGVGVRGYVSCVTDCPYEGPVAQCAVAQVAEALHRMGCTQISLGDTIGAGTPETIGRMLDAVPKTSATRVCRGPKNLVDA